MTTLGSGWRSSTYARPRRDRPGRLQRCSAPRADRRTDGDRRRDPKGDGTRLNPDVGVTEFDLRVAQGHAFAVPPLARWLRWWRPDVLFANGTAGNSAAILARLVSGVSTRVVAIEHTHYSSFIPTGGIGRRLRRVRDLETRLLYPLADAVAGVSIGVRNDLARRFRGSDRSSSCYPSRLGAHLRCSGSGECARSIRGSRSARRLGS